MKTNKVSFIIVLGILMLSLSSQALAETEPNNNYASPNAISLDSPMTGTISTKGDVDWYTLTTDVVGDLTVTQTEWPPYIETRIAVYGPNNPSLLQNNPVTSAAPGTYYIKVWSANDGSSIAPYKFSASLKKAITGNDIDGGKNSASGAVPITIGTAVSDTIAPSKETAGKQDVDWYTLTTDAVGDLTVTQTEWPGYIETRIAVFGPNDPALAQNNPVKNAAPGTYYIKVWSANDGSSIAPYKFNVNGKQGTTSTPISTATQQATATPAPTTSTTPCLDFGIPGGTCIFSNGNIGGVSNNPTSSPTFTLTNTYQIISITNYHWNSARGASPGTIGLKDSAGKTYGPWAVTTRPGQGGVSNAYWDALPDIVLGPGTYTVIDSDTSTWSHNSESKNQGMSIVKGTLVSSAATSTPGTTPAVGAYKKCEGTQPYLYIDDRKMESGKTVELPVIMCNAVNLANMDITLNYDSSVLKIKDVIKGSLNAKSMFDWNPVSAGKLKLSFAGKDGVSGSGSIAVLIFDVIGKTGAKSSITGTVTTASKTDGGKMSLTVNPGKFSAEASTIKGDCDGDNELTERDALAALQMSVEKRAVNMCFDYNGDGNVDSSDAREMLKAIVGGGKIDRTPQESSQSIVEPRMVGPTIINVPYDTISESITPNKGGTIQDGGMRLIVPSGAVTEDTKVIVKKLKADFSIDQGRIVKSLAPSAVAVSDAYDFGPEGIVFQKPVQITIPYDERALPKGANERDVQLAYFDGKKWVAVGGIVDTEKNTVSVGINKFPGLLVEAVLGTIIVAGWGYVGKKLYDHYKGDPIKNGDAHKYVTPTDPVVNGYAQNARLVSKSAGDEIPLDNPRLLAEWIKKHDKEKLPLGFKDGNGLQTLEGRYTDSEVWKMPGDYFTKYNSKGDCTDVTNAAVSIFLAKGYPTKAVFGYQGDKDHPHAWGEVVIGGKVYLIDEEGTLEPLDDAMKKMNLIRPDSNDPRNRMWDDKKTEPYNKDWYKPFLDGSATSTATPTPTQTQTAKATSSPIVNAPGGGSSSGTFPDATFNGLQITYSVSGASITSTEDKSGFTTSRTLKGTLGTGNLVVSGSAKANPPACGTSYGSFYTYITVEVWAGSNKKAYTIPDPIKCESASESYSFSLSVPIPEGATTGGFDISETLVNPRFGNRGLVVSGSFGE